MPKERGPSSRRKPVARGGGGSRADGGAQVPDAGSPAGERAFAVRRMPSGPNRAADEQSYFVRKVLFAIFAALVLAGTLLLAMRVLDRGSGAPHRDIRVETGGVYTVRMSVLPAAQERAAVGLMSEPAIVSLAAGHEIFLRNLPQDRLALCVGRFKSAEDPGAKGLLGRVQSFEVRPGQRVFAGADLWVCPPQRGP